MSELVSHPGRTWTHQELYDNAVNGIRRQGYRRCMVGSSCSYRDGDFACAVGWSIPDAVIEEIRNHSHHSAEAPLIYSSIGVLTQSLQSVADLIPAESVPMVRELQHLHDDYLDPHHEEWEGREEIDVARFETMLRQVAENYGLIYTPPSDTTGAKA